MKHKGIHHKFLWQGTFQALGQAAGDNQLSYEGNDARDTVRPLLRGSQVGPSSIELGKSELILIFSSHRA